MTVVEALPMDIYEALYHYCKDDESLNDAFIRALRTELFRWHDLRKNPDDLPPLERGSYTVNVLTDNGDIACYDYDSGCWVEEPANCEIDSPVAWCEIPKYTEE